MIEEPVVRYHRHRFPAEIIAHAVWLYHRFPLSLRDVEDLLAERGIDVSFQTVSEWVVIPGVEHRSHKVLNNRAENSHLPLRRRERRMMRFKSARQCQRFVSVHGQVTNLFHLHRKYLTATDHRQLRTQAVTTWREIALSIDA